MIYRIIKKLLNLSIGSLRPPHLSINVSQINYGGILRGQRVLITGGSRGIGLAIAKKFLSEGAVVLVTGRNLEKLQEIAHKVNNKNFYYMLHDVNDINSYDAFLQSVAEKIGGIDILVSNAGISLHEGFIENVTSEGFDKTYLTNFKANYFLAKSYIKTVVGKQNGNILFVTSKDGAVCNDIPYGLTKASMNSLVGALSCRYYAQGIRVNAIAPGVTLTDMTKSYAQKEDGNMYSNNYAGRNFLPLEVAEVACFIVSDAANCVSGQILFTDAGDHLKSNVQLDR